MENDKKNESDYPVLNDGETTAVRDEEKAEMLANSFVKIHSSESINEEGKRGRETTIEENEELLQHKEDTSDLLNKPFTKTELNRSQENQDVSTRQRIRLLSCNDKPSQ